MRGKYDPLRVVSAPRRSGGYLRVDEGADAAAAFNVGEGDFSVVAAIVTQVGGGLIYRGDPEGSAVGGGLRRLY